MLRLVVCLFFAACVVKGANQISLQSPHESVAYKPFSWKMKSKYVQFVIEFMTNSSDGQLFDLGMEGMMESAFPLSLRLTATVEDGFLTINILKDDYLSDLSESYSRLLVNDGRVHRVVFMFTSVSDWAPRFLDISAFYQQANRCPEKLSDQVHEQYYYGDTVNMSLVFGNEDGTSAVACIQYEIQEKISRKRSKIVLSRMDNSTNTTDVCMDAPKSDTFLQCKNRGVCKELSTKSVCDCYSTGYWGPSCEKKAYGIRLEEANIDYYYPEQTEYPTRYSFDFKLPSYPAPIGSSRFELLRARILGQKVRKHTGFEPWLEVYFENNHLTLSYAFGYSTLQKWPFVLDCAWHSFSLKIDDRNRRFEGIFDGKTRKVQFDFYWIPNREEIEVDANRTVSFGGFTGCLKNVYVDHYQIVDMLKSNDHRVTSSGVLVRDSCGHEDKNNPITCSASIFTPVSAIVLIIFSCVYSLLL